MNDNLSILIDKIRSIYPTLSNSYKEFILTSTAYGHNNLLTGSTLVKKDQPCEKIYFLAKGTLRYYDYIDEDMETTSAFAEAGDFIYFPEIEFQGYHKEYVEAAEDCELVVVTRTDLMNIYKSFPETQVIVKLIANQCNLALKKRLRLLEIKTPELKFEYLLEHYPGLLYRMNINQVASFAGIGKSTLYTLMNKLYKRARF